MTNQVSNQTQRRLANDLCLNVLRAMKYHAIIACSFVSKRALALVQSLHLPIKSVRIIMTKDPVIEFDFGTKCIVLEFKMGKNDEQKASLNELPLNVNVYKGDDVDLALTMSNQGLTLGEWIQHLCSISKKVKLYLATFYAADMKFEYQSLRNSFPKLRKIEIYCSPNETTELNTLAAQNILRAFLPCAKEVQLFRVPLGENLSYQHIGMSNLESLDIVHPINMNVDCLFTLNVQMCTIHSNQLPLRELNRFFKLWIKGSNPRVEALRISCDTETVPDWSVLLKGLRTKELDEVEEELEDYEDEQEDEEVEEEEEEDDTADEEEQSVESEFEDESGEELDEEEIEGEGKKFFIMNCTGIRGQIEVKYFAATASVTFSVSKIN